MTPGPATQTRRLFIAVMVPTCPGIERFRDDLAALGRAVRPVPAGALHLTLEFLGDVRQDSTATVIEAMDEAASLGRGGRMQVHGVGTFPPRGAPRVVWLGVREAEPIRLTVELLRAALDDRSFGGDRRPWSAHLTVARIRGPAPPGLSELLSAHRDTAWTSHRADRFHLIASTLTPAGPTYQVVHSSHLTAGKGK